MGNEHEDGGGGKDWCQTSSLFVGLLVLLLIADC